MLKKIILFANEYEGDMGVGSIEGLKQGVGEPEQQSDAEVIKQLKN